MLTTALLLSLGALASLTTAQYHAAIHPGLAAKRDLAARQTDSPFGGDDSGGDDAATSCINDLMSIYSSLPTPPPEIFSWEESNTITDPCSITVPASLSSAFSSYESEALSWFSEHSAEIVDALSDCPLYSSLAPGVGDGDVCTEGSGSGGGGQVATTEEDDTKTTDAAETTTRTTGRTTGTTSTPTGGATGAGQVASTQSGNVGPRETGFVAGAVALAGFLGVVAAL